MSCAILFDLDGTLADTAPDLAYALNRVRQNRGLAPLPYEKLRPHASAGARGLLFAGFAILPEDPGYEPMRDEFLDIYTENLCRETRLFPGIPELLDDLDRRGVRWGVVTNKHARFTLPLLKALGLAERAGCVISGDTTTNSKPHPEPLLAACQTLGVAPDHCIYVGDDQRDTQASLAAGMRSIIAHYGYLGTGDHPETWQAHGIIDTPADLLKYLL